MLPALPLCLNNIYHFFLPFSAGTSPLPWSPMTEREVHYHVSSSQHSAQPTEVLKKCSLSEEMNGSRMQAENIWRGGQVLALPFTKVIDFFWDFCAHM